MKILFITSNRVGDAVLSTGVLARLMQDYPTAHFTIACGPYAGDLFRAVPRLENLIILEKKSWNRHWLELWKACIGTRWDIIVDLRDSIVSRLLIANRRCYRQRLAGQHKARENATALGLTGNDIPAPHIWLDAAAENEAAKLLGDARPLLAIAPSANWPCKQWPAERFKELAEKLANGPMAGARIVVIAGSKEREQIAPVLQLENHIEVIGKDLLTAAACLKQCQLFIGNDSGLMHVAAAMGTPTLGLFGPGYEEIYGPWGPHCAFVRTPESRDELLTRLPDASAREPNLMGGLTVEVVMAAATELLHRTV